MLGNHNKPVQQTYLKHKTGEKYGQAPTLFMFSTVYRVTQNKFYARPYTF
jgi:hypothetical protein